VRSSHQLAGDGAGAGGDRYWTPPDEKIPALLWIRILRDLDGDLVERSGGCLYGWLHRQHEEAAMDRFAGTPALCDMLRRNLVAYFQAELEDAAVTAEGFASDRTVTELPWLYQQLGDIVRLKAALTAPALFPVIIDRFQMQSDFDVFRAWDATGCSKTEIGDLFVAVLKAETERYNQDETDVMFLYNIAKQAGSYLDYAGCFAAAIDAYSVAGECIEKIYGRESAENSANFNNMGIAYMRTGNEEDADRMYTQAIEINERLLPNSKELDGVLNNYAGESCRRCVDHVMRHVRA